MNNVVSAFLGAIQGVTEFLPVSSTAHTMIFAQLFSECSANSAAQDAFSVFLNIGSLLALTVFYRTEIAKLFFGTLDLFF